MRKNPAARTVVLFHPEDDCNFILRNVRCENDVAAKIPLTWSTTSPTFFWDPRAYCLDHKSPPHIPTTNQRTPLPDRGLLTSLKRSDFFFEMTRMTARDVVKTSKSYRRIRSTPSYAFTLILSSDFFCQIIPNDIFSHPFRFNYLNLF